jgi:F-type H+-transporting ATPase subunit b
MLATRPLIYCAAWAGLFVVLCLGTPRAAWAESEPADAASGAEQPPADAEHAAHGGPVPLRFDPDLALWTALVFGGLLLVMTKFAWTPIRAALQAREKQVEDHLAVAHNQEAESKRMMAAYEAQLQEAAGEVRDVLEQARREAEQEKADILAEAKAAAHAEHERSIREVLNSKDAAMAQIGQMAGGLAVELAGRVIEREVPGDKHASLVRDEVAAFPRKVSSQKS